MFWQDEVVVLAMDEKGRNVGILHMLYGVQFLNIEVVLYCHTCTFYLTVDLTKDRAMPLKTANFPPCLSASSFDSFSKLEKGESRTTHPIS